MVLVTVRVCGKGVFVCRKPIKTMTGSICSVAVDTSDLPVQCLCGCVHCCLNKVVQQTVPARRELKKARPLKHKQKFQESVVSCVQPTAQEKLYALQENAKESEEASKDSVCVSPGQLHKKRPSFQCDLCKCHFTRKHSLTVHLQRRMCQQNQENVDTANSQVALDQSLKDTVASSSQSCKTASLKSSFRCGLCSTTFQSAALLYNHIKEAHTDAPGQEGHLTALTSAALPLCHTCGKAFHSLSALASHHLVRVLAPYKCVDQT